MIAVSFVLAILSWKFVETPFRKGRLRIGGRQLFSVAAAVMAVCAIFALIASKSDGWPRRFDQEALRPAAYLDKAEMSRDVQLEPTGTCFVDATTGQTSIDFGKCLRWDPNKKNYLLFGRQSCGRNLARADRRRCLT